MRLPRPGANPPPARRAAALRLMRHSVCGLAGINKSAHVISPASFARLLAVAVSASLVAPAAAHAHALFGDNDPNRPLWEYLTLGFGHMVGGWDHLLFIAGVVLLAGNWRRAAKLVSLFVAGHSLTLLVATIAGWKLNATLVDVVIALSLVYVGVQGFRGRPERLEVFGAVVFAFGLVHGLGLSTRLQDLGLPESGVVARVLLFNVGVEVGQLVALGVIVGLGTLLARSLANREQAARYTLGAIAVSGLIAAAVISFPDKQTRTESVAERSAGEEDGTSEDGAQQLGACRQSDSQPPRFIGGDHPDKMFFGPKETAPVEDLTHVIGDGLVIVRYRPDIPATDVKQLEAFVNDPTSGEYVIGAPDPEQKEPVRAVAALRTLSCEKVDMTGLQTFRDDWFAYVRAQQQNQPSG